MARGEFVSYGNFGDMLIGDAEKAYRRAMRLAGRGRREDAEYPLETGRALAAFIREPSTRNMTRLSTAWYFEANLEQEGGEG